MRPLAALGLLLCASGCQAILGFGDTTLAVPDGESADAPVAEPDAAGLADAPLPDTPLPDTPLPDAPRPDAPPPARPPPRRPPGPGRRRPRRAGPAGPPRGRAPPRRAPRRRPRRPRRMRRVHDLGRLHQRGRPDLPGLLLHRLRDRPAVRRARRR